MTEGGMSRSSCPEVFCKKGVLENSTKFTGKHLRQSLVFNKVAGLKPATLLKKRLWRRCFPVNFMKFLRTPFFTEHPRWLLLNEGKSEIQKFDYLENEKNFLVDEVKSIFHNYLRIIIC